MSTAVIETNLATRPFHDDRGALLAVVVGYLLVLALTVFTAQRLVSLSAEASRSSAAPAEQELASVRADTDAIRARLASDELADVSDAADEASAIIALKAFSWTELLTHFERTLPDDVRITSIQPTTSVEDAEADGDGVLLSLSVVGRNVESLGQFMEALTGTDVFSDVLSVEERRTEDGDLVASIQSRYRPAASSPSSPPAGEADGRPSDGRPSEGRPSEGGASGERP